MADRFLIAPYDQQSGLETDIKPFLIPDNAFSELDNAYVWRGRVRKRFGSQWLNNDPLLTRLRIKLPLQTDGAGNVVTNIPANLLPITVIGQLFSVDTQVFTVVTLVGPFNLLASGTANGTFNPVTGVVTINGAAATTDVYYYPALPVMGLLTAEVPEINDEKIIGFDTRFAYQYTTGWQRLNGEATPGASTWTGTDTDFHWSCNWSGVEPSDKIFFVTNNVRNDPHHMRWMNPTGAIVWNDYRPQISHVVPVPGTTNDQYLDTCRILVVFKNRLIALNTWESFVTTVAPAPPVIVQRNYQGRARWSWEFNPLDATAWSIDASQKGQAIDAATSEAIITAEFVKDRLVVYFERSTWELVYTGNEIKPFAWQRINTELGAESTHSIVPFDKVCLGVGNVGIMACNGSNVERIDAKIPDTVFEILNANNAINRVYGIRDYFTEMVYWTMPNSTDDTALYPNRVLTYNYKTNTWSFNDDSITCFGYYQQLTGLTWDSTTVTWDDPVGWGSGPLIAQFRQIIGGNQEGFTFLCRSDISTNASVIQITDLTVVAGLVTIMAINHNFVEGDYLYLQGIVDTGTLGAVLNDRIFQVVQVIDPNTFTLDASGALVGTYKGAGLISRVSQISLKTKEFNFYMKQGRNAYISKVDFFVDATADGQIQVNYYDSSTVPALVDNSVPGVLLGASNLDTYPYIAGGAHPAAAPIPFEENAARLWHPVYFDAEGNVVQFWIVLDDTQMRDVDIRKADFQMHAMLIHAMPTSQRIY